MRNFKLIAVISSIVVLAIIVVVMLSSFLNRIFFSPPVNSTIEDKNNINSNKTIQINILNATDSTGIANTAKNFLTSRGFDVVEISNFKKKEMNSYILDRLGDIKSTKKVAYAIGIEDSLIKREIDSTLFLNATIILGKDFKKLKPFK